MLAKGINVGKSLCNPDFINKIKEILNKYDNKIIFPTDFYVDNNNRKEYRKINDLTNEDTIYDIGEESLNSYKEIINNSNTIFINGTVGMYENKEYEYGTKKLFEILKDSNKKVFVGGGDAVSATNKLGYEDSFYYKSTGGGATLEYIIEKKLIALED